MEGKNESRLKVILNYLEKYKIFSKIYQKIDISLKSCKNPFQGFFRELVLAVVLR